VVYSAEIEPELARTAGERLASLGIANVVIRVGDGISIFRDAGPFDAILAAAAPLAMPHPLLEQLAEGGRCILPVGPSDSQYLYQIERIAGRLVERQLDAVRFVPLRSPV
jgi:protein-L-isoaspartate(D-aspartate) O-methyltransferase